MRSILTTQVVRGSTGLAGQGSCLARSYGPSPRIYCRMSCGQDIACCILVTVMMCLALGAAPFADGQRKIFDNVPTNVTAFARREEAVNQLQFLPVPFAFVGDHMAELRERRVREAASQAVVSHHSSHVQVFHADHVESSHQTGRYFMQMVTPSVCDVRLNFRDSQASFLASFASFLPSGQYSLSTSHPPLPLVGMPEIGNSFSCRKCSQSGDSEIDTHGLASFRHRLNQFVEDQRHEVPPGRILGYRRGCGVTCERSRPADFEFAELDNGQRAGLGIPLESRPRVLGRLPVSLLFEHRIARSFLEEVLECRLEMPQCLLGWNTRHFIQPGVFFVPLESCQCGRRGVVVNRLAISITVRAKPQGEVVDVPTTTKHASKQLGLFGIRIETESVSEFHKLSIAIVTRLSRCPRNNRNGFSSTS